MFSFNPSNRVRILLLNCSYTSYMEVKTNGQYMHQHSTRKLQHTTIQSRQDLKKTKDTSNLLRLKNSLLPMPYSLEQLTVTNAAVSYGATNKQTSTIHHGQALQTPLTLVSGCLHSDLNNSNNSSIKHGSVMNSTIKKTPGGEFNKPSTHSTQSERKQFKHLKYAPSMKLCPRSARKQGKQATFLTYLLLHENQNP